MWIQLLILQFPSYVVLSQASGFCVFFLPLMGFCLAQGRHQLKVVSVSSVPGYSLKLTPSPNHSLKSLLEPHAHAMRFSPDKNRRTGSILKRRERRGKASNHVLTYFSICRSQHSAWHTEGTRIHICDWMIKWTNFLFTYLQVFLDSLLHIRKCSMLSELELDIFQQKNISNLFEDSITDIRWNYDPP